MVLIRSRIDLLHEVHSGNGDRGRVGELNVSQSPGTSGSGAEDGFSERRPGGLQQDQSLGELGTSIGNDNGHYAALAVANENHGLANLVQQRGTGILNRGLLVDSVINELDVGAVESVKDGIAHGAIAWPLRVQSGLWPQIVVLDGGETLLDYLS